MNAKKLYSLIKVKIKTETPEVQIKKFKIIKDLNASIDFRQIYSRTSLNIDLFIKLHAS